MQVTINVESELLVRDIVCQSRNQSAVFELIKEIDLAVADVGFTELLAKHFIAELAKEAKAAGETFDLSELAPQ